MNFCIDEKPEDLLYSIWNKLNKKYFPDLDLSSYKLTWSTRNQKRTLACCNVKRKVVRVAKELNYIEHYKWLSPLLYHEMCHAVQAYDLIDQNGKLKHKIRWHGRDFKELEKMHPLYNDFQVWIKNGGWNRAIRSSRAKEWWGNIKGNIKNVFKIK